MANKSVIIIGSGMGGLIAGNLLAKKGHKVTLFESHSSPGGYTAGFYRKGFYFESGTLSFEASPSIFKAMRDIGVFDRVSFVRQKARWVSEDFDSTVDSYHGFKSMLYGAFLSEKDSLDRYFSEVDKMHKASSLQGKIPMPFLYSGFPQLWATVGFILSTMKSMILSKKYADLTIGEFNARIFDKDSKLYRFLTNLGYPDMGAWVVGGMMTMFDDYWTVHGGMQSWANALAENLQRLGGELRLSSLVEKILTRDGAAIGVSSKNTNFYADYIISACDYKKTFLKLLDDRSLAPKDLLERIEKAAVSESFFTVYLGLNISNDELKGHLKIPYVLYIDDKPGTDIHNPDDEEFFQKTSISLYSPSMMNPDLAPTGKSSLMLQALSPPGWMQNWGGGSRQKYKQLKEKVRKTLIRRAEAIVPNLSSLAEFEDAATPLTYERYTHNTAGASSAWSWNPKKKFFTNVMGAYIETPVKNLYVGSCWTNQIGGVPGALIAAYLCAKKVK